MSTFDTSASFSEARVQSFMQRVYQWMAVGLGLTGAVALWVAHHPEVAQTFASGGMLFVLVLIQFGLVWWLSSSILRLSVTTAILGYAIYAALNGLMLSFIFMVYTGASIASTFFVTAGTFAATSLYGWVTKRDMTSMRGFLMMSIIGLVIASIVNIFFKSPVLYWITTYIGVFVFVLLTAFDTQRLKRIHQSEVAGFEQLAVMGALQLYLDFINMFLYLLRIFGRRR